MVKSSLSALAAAGLEKQHFPANFADKYALRTTLLAELSQI
jgi:hypothetical protein